MTSTDALRENILAAARRSKDASRTIGLLTTSQKNTILRTAAAALHERADEILAANQKDIDDARSRGTSDAMIDRLALDSARIDGIAGGLTQVADLPDPIGEVIRGRTLENGLKLRQVRVPLGVIGIVYEARPNVTVPTIETGTGNCHIYLHADADLNMGIACMLNGKTRRCSVCNATETVLVDKRLGDQALHTILEALGTAGVTVHGDLPGLVPATDKDWGTEYLSMDIALKVVDGLDEAINHINTWGSGHSEAIITTNVAAAQEFTDRVNAAAVYVNTSTAFTDGEQFGMGAEMGISTQKLHARGPMALPELTSAKWVIWGTGQTRP